MEMNKVADIVDKKGTQFGKKKKGTQFGKKKKKGCPNLVRGACKKEEEERIPNLVRQLVTGIG